MSIGFSDILSALQNGVAAIRGLNTANTNLIAALDANSSALVTVISSGFGRLAHWGAPWIFYFPTVSAGTGTLTTASATGRYIQLGKTVLMAAQAVITTNGTGGTELRVTLPIDILGASHRFPINAQMTPITTLQATIYPGDATFLRCYTSSGAYPGADGTTFDFSGFYESV